MRSAVPKVLHTLGGRSLLGHALAAASDLKPQRVAVVVRHERDQVAAHATELAPSVVVVDQDEQVHALRATVRPGSDRGEVLVTVTDAFRLGQRRRYSRAPLALAATVAGLADGVIVGSRIVRAADEGGAGAVRSIVAELAEALR